MTKHHNITTAPTAQIAPFGLRMLPELRDLVERSARASGRSMNAEIVSRLQQTFEADRPLTREEICDLVANTMMNFAAKQ